MIKLILLIIIAGLIGCGSEKDCDPVQPDRETIGNEAFCLLQFDENDSELGECVDLYDALDDLFGIETDD